MPYFMLRILPVDAILESITSLNFGRRDLFNFIHKWAKDYVLNNGVYVKPVHVYLKGSEDTLKSHLAENICNAVPKIRHFNYKDPEKLKILLGSAH